MLKMKNFVKINLNKQILVMFYALNSISCNVNNCTQKAVLNIDNQNPNVIVFNIQANDKYFIYEKNKEIEFDNYDTLFNSKICNKKKTFLFARIVLCDSITFNHYAINEDNKHISIFCYNVNGRFYYKKIKSKLPFKPRIVYVKNENIFTAYLNNESGYTISLTFNNITNKIYVTKDDGLTEWNGFGKAAFKRN